MKDYLQYNFIDVTNFRDKLKYKKQSLIEELEEVKTRLEIVEDIINRNEEKERNWLILLPKEILSNKKIDPLPKKKKVNWKNLVVSLITKCDHPMTSEMLYFKAKILYDNIPDDRVHCISNISAALHYLVFSDGKLYRTKEDNQRTYMYGLHHFFGVNGRVKEEYIKKFEMERNGKLRNRIKTY